MYRKYGFMFSENAIKETIAILLLRHVRGLEIYIYIYIYICDRKIGFTSYGPVPVAARSKA